MKPIGYLRIKSLSGNVRDRQMTVSKSYKIDGHAISIEAAVPGYGGGWYVFYEDDRGLFDMLATRIKESPRHSYEEVRYNSNKRYSSDTLFETIAIPEDGRVEVFDAATGRPLPDKFKTIDTEDERFEYLRYRAALEEARSPFQRTIKHGELGSGINPRRIRRDAFETDQPTAQMRLEASQEMMASALGSGASALTEADVKRLIGSRLDGLQELLQQSQAREVEYGAEIARLREENERLRAEGVAGGLTDQNAADDAEILSVGARSSSEQISSISSSKERTGRCSASECGRTLKLNVAGNIPRHGSRTSPCSGSRKKPLLESSTLESTG